MGKAIIFDLFGTLCGSTSPEQECIKRYKLDPSIHDKLQLAVCGTKFTNWDEYLSNFAKAAGIKDNSENRRRLKGIINYELANKATKIPEGRDEALDRLLKSGYKLAIVSNSYPPTREAVIEGGWLTRFFHDPNIVLSYEIGMTKQNPEIYNICLERLGVKAEDAVMIGDSLKSDILMSKKATDGKIKGILITDEYKTISELKYLTDIIK